MASFTKKGMFAGVELSGFEKPGGILHSTRCPLDTLDKLEGRSLQKWKVFCFLKYCWTWENNNENGKELCPITPWGWHSQFVPGWTEGRPWLWECALHTPLGVTLHFVFRTHQFSNTHIMHLYITFFMRKCHYMLLQGPLQNPTNHNLDILWH